MFAARVAGLLLAAPRLAFRPSSASVATAKAFVKQGITRQSATYSDFSGAAGKPAESKLR